MIHSTLTQDSRLDSSHIALSLNLLDTICCVHFCFVGLGLGQLLALGYKTGSFTEHHKVVSAHALCRDK